MRSQAHRRSPPQLAVFARPSHRRICRNLQPGDRLKAETPRSQGYRMPAEWEPHEATWIAWPHNKSDWPGRFAPIPWVYGEIVRKLAVVEKVRILVGDEGQPRKVLKSVGANLANVEFYACPTNRVWARDFGPIFVFGKSIAITHWRFNAWAKYDDWRLDAKVPAFISKKLKIRRVEPGLVLEGGSIDVNGQGLLLTTEECLL